jgi:AcrR family transcriptional regulator
MREETKKRRHEAIAAAAYTLLAEKGYDGASMLSIAKMAKASNETLYRWYGDKQGLFRALVQDNAAQIADELGQAIRRNDDPMQTLERVAPVFLTMLLGERAVLLNRAAASEPTGELGVALSAGGRDVVQPLFKDVMMGVAKGDNAQAEMLTGAFLGLLVGDLQIKRVIGVHPVLTQAQIDARVTGALRLFRKLVEK